MGSVLISTEIRTISVFNLIFYFWLLCLVFLSFPAISALSLNQPLYETKEQRQEQENHSDEKKDPLNVAKIYKINEFDDIEDISSFFFEDELQEDSWGDENLTTKNHRLEKSMGKSISDSDIESGIKSDIESDIEGIEHFFPQYSEKKKNDIQNSDLRELDVFEIPGNIPESVASIRLLDMQTAQIYALDIRVGQVYERKRVEIQVLACFYNNSLPYDEHFAFLKIYDRSWQQGNGDRELFKGWMVSSSPFLASFDDYRYNVWLRGCKAV